MVDFLWEGCGKVVGKPPASMTDVSQRMVDSICQQCCSYPKENPMAVLAVNKYVLRSGMTEAYVEWATANIQV